MEDRYLFRGKRIDNREWAIGNSIYDGVTGQVFIHTVGNSVNESDKVGEEGCLQFVAFEVDPSTICQCTGLKDKNGNLIWENDIIECKDGKHNFQTQIEWDAYCAGFIFQDTETSAVGLDAITANGLYSESKVVSNIFDNQELLEV